MLNRSGVELATRVARITAASLTLLASSAVAQGSSAPAGAGVGPVSPLAIGETFVLQSKVMGEARRINVYAPPPYSATPDARLPVLYMPDGGLGEDFLHVAGLVEVLVGNGTMRPFLLVGIENTQRRRDLTGPTQNADDRKIAPTVGGSATFRQFIKSELIPAINARYRTTGEKAIIGESLAGLFVVETFYLDPDLFDSYIAFDPSIWWNNNDLVTHALDRLPRISHGTRTLYISCSSEKEITRLTRQLTDSISAHTGIKVIYEPMPAETHATIYHPAALIALRRVFAPQP